MNLLAFLVAFFATLTTTPIVKKVAVSLRVVDQPNQRKIHNNPIPLLGSIAVFLGIILSLVISGGGWAVLEKMSIILFVGTSLLIVGKNHSISSIS